MSHAPTPETLRIGTRGSQLALTQTHQMRDRLHDLHGEALDVEVEIIRTTGDANQGSLSEIGGEGVFTVELERALLDGRIDIAVHSLKDLPTRLHPELELVAAPQRVDVRDALITSGASTLEALPEGACLGSGSLRRQCQLLALRPDLRFEAIRGNVDTRIAKVRDGVVDGVVLAAAGLHRLGLEREISCYLDTAQMLPAPGQASLGLEMRRDHAGIALVTPLNHAPTMAGVTAERSFLEALGGGCRAPIAAWGRVLSDELYLDGRVGSADGAVLLHDSLIGSPDEARECGVRLAEQLVQSGARSLLPAP